MHIFRTVKPSLLFFLAAFGVVALFGIYFVLKTDATRMVSLLGIMCAILVVQYSTYAALKARSAKHTNLWSFVVALSLWGLLFLLLFPPFSVPDEPYHYFAAYQLSDALMFLGQGENNTLPMRTEDVEFVTDGMLASPFLQAGSYGEIARGAIDVSVNGEIIDYTLKDHAISQFDIPASLTSNPLQDRLAPALGITFGRLLGLNAIITFYCGRLFSLATFAAIVTFAVKAIPTGRTIVMAVSLLPMTLHLAASYSYDSFTIAMSFLLISLVLDAVLARKRITVKRIALIALVAAVLAPCKVVYALSVLLFLFAKRSQFGSKRQCWAAKTAVLGAAALSIVAFKAVDVVAMLSHDATTGPDMRGSDSGEFYDLAFILQNPRHTIGVYGRTLMQTLDHNLRTLIGGSLGWFQGNLAAPLYILVALYLALAASCIRSRNDNTKIPTSIRVGGFAVASLCWSAVMTSMLLGWTFNTEYVISGLQGRYFLPVLPLLLLVLRPARIECSYNLAFWCPFVLCAANAVYVLHMSAAVLVPLP